MSIIEKAVDKLINDPPPEPVTPEQLALASDVAAKPSADGVKQPTRAEARPAASPAEEHRVAATVKLDQVRLRALGMLTPDNTESAVAEEFRKIKLPLLANISKLAAKDGSEGNLILITSSVKGEGKTRSTVNLCISMAMELDRTVLLVDTDVVVAGASELLGIASRRGLTDIITQSDVGLSDVIVGTDIKGLDVLPVGTRVSNISELYASDAMKNLMQELATGVKDRVVVFDSPPVLGATEASVLATMVDQIVIVVEAEKTPEHLLIEAIGILGSANVVGCILNKSNQKLRSDYHYGYST